MKNMKNKILFYLGLLLIPFLNSCEEDGQDITQPPLYEATLADIVSLKFGPSSDDATSYFQYNVDVKTGNAYWAITDLEFDVNLILGEYTASDISKIEFYIFAEEKNGESYKYLGGDQGKLYTTINNPSESFLVSFSKDELADLFANDFSDNHNGDVLVDDVFELKWVITGKDESVKDTRTDCADFNCTYGFGTKVAYVDTWVGEFQYNWIDIGADTIKYSWAKVGTNPTGIVKFSQTNTDAKYDVDDLSMGGCYKISPGYVTYDATINQLNVFNYDSFLASKWELISITPTVLTVKWTYYYSQWYSEYGTIEIIRNDGLSWPAGLTIVNN